MKELWLPIKDFDGLYEVSNFGRIKSLPKAKAKKERIIKPSLQICNGGKYRRFRVNLRKNGKTYQYKVHRMVLEAFKGPPIGDKKYCRHLDGNSLNNHIDNLEWGTALENTSDSIIHGTKTDPPAHFGENHPNAIMSDDQVNELRSLSVSKGQYSHYARKYNVSAQTIKRIVNFESRA